MENWNLVVMARLKGKRIWSPMNIETLEFVNLEDASMVRTDCTGNEVGVMQYKVDLANELNKSIVIKLELTYMGESK